MSLDKAIQHGKEKRKPYRDSRAFDRSCRNHGDCPYCAGKRQHKYKIAEQNAKDAINVYYQDEQTHDNM
jgi:hypothetical protein